MTTSTQSTAMAAHKLSEGDALRNMEEAGPRLVSEQQAILPKAWRALDRVVVTGTELVLFLVGAMFTISVTLAVVTRYLLDFSPQYDAIYLQWMLALYGLEGNRTLYELAADNARDAQTRALNGEGLYLLSWNGEVLPAQDALPGMLQTQAATTSLFAWLAVYTPPPQS